MIPGDRWSRDAAGGRIRPLARPADVVDSDLAVPREGELDTVAAFLRDLLEGRRDLGSRLPLPPAPQAGEVATLLNRLVDEMQRLLAEVDEQTNRVGVGAAKNVRRIAKTAKEQSLDTKAAVESISQARQAGEDVAQAAELASESAQLTLKMAVQGEDVIDGAVRRVQQSRQVAEDSAAALALLVGHSGEVASSQGNLTEISRLATRSTNEMNSVAAANEQIATTLDQVASRVNRLFESSRAMAENVEAAATSEEIGLATAEIHHILGKYRLGTFTEQVRDWAMACADEISAVMEKAIDDRKLSLEQLLEMRYQEIKGPMIQRIRLFDVRKVPQEGFSPPKYATSWDHILDLPVRTVLDKYLSRDRRLNNVCVPDLNGYNFTHLTKYCPSHTGDPRIDGVQNRAKWITDYPVVLGAARVGLKRWDKVPKRATRSQFLAAGVDPDQKLPPVTFLLQTQARDTGDTVCDLAVPFFVKGKRYGAVRIGFLAE